MSLSFLRHLTGRLLKEGLAVGCLIAFGLAGCAEKPLPPGVVAMVNEQPITLRQIEAVYDSSARPLVLAQSPSPELLQSQYGEVLGILVARALVEQELDRLGHTITDPEVAAAEAEARADYLPGEFEAALQEEYIDLAAWRELLRQRLVMERFQERVLRPRIRISAEEVQNIYAADPRQFYQPRKLDLRVFAERDKNRAENLRRALIAGEAPGLEDQPLRLPFSRLPEVWRKDFASGRPGTVSGLIEADGLYQFARLERDIPEARLNVLEAYPLIEAQLVEAKLDEAFAGWLENTLRKTRIRVVPELVAAFVPPKPETPFDPGAPQSR